VATVELEKLTLYYGKVLAVDDISLRIEDHELCVLLGPTGCGKTSTMRMIAGLETPTAGRVYLDGDVINHLYPGDRDVAMVFQDYALYPHMTVAQHLAFPLKARDVSRQDIKRQVQETADFLGLGDLLTRFPSELSSGQQQRVAIGRALIRTPRVFLMDEPLGQLDGRTRAEMRASLKRLQRDLGITTIYVTHDQVEAQSLGDKIVVMKLGVIQQVGTPQEIYGEPANLFVAGFIGTPSMNFLDCSLHAGDGEFRLRNDQFTLALSSGIASKAQTTSSQTELVMGVRPEHVRLSPDEQPDTIPMEVEVVEPQSSEYVVGLKLGEHLLKAKQDRRSMGFKPQAGQKVWADFLQTKMHLFDKDTEVRLA
jgi:multiple sugar transport system ATP-binding protein